MNVRPFSPCAGQTVPPALSDHNSLTLLPFRDDLTQRPSYSAIPSIQQKAPTRIGQLGDFAIGQVADFKLGHVTK